MPIEQMSWLSSRNLIMACHITGVYDVNRNNTLENDNYELVRRWAESIADCGLRGILFHNNFSLSTCQKYTNANVSFIKIEHSRKYNPNVYRYFVYRDFLNDHLHLLDHLIVTDTTDVTVAKNPFGDRYFIDNPRALFCGDEPKKLHNEWMLAHSEHLRSQLADYANYEAQYANETLLNCGIIGGNARLMMDFIERLCGIHEQANSENKTAYTGDMGAFNYLVRTQFNSQVRHGSPVNTIFKGYEEDRTDCWFRHK